jgi:predicted Zn-dependent peptidase
MSHLARQFIFFGEQYTLDQMTRAIDAVTVDDVRRVATELFQDDALAATVVGPAGRSPFAAPLRMVR